MEYNTVHPYRSKDMILDIAEVFSRAPVGRLREDSNNSGQRFREEWLRPKIEEAMKQGEKLEVLFGGLKGVSTSFMEEAFGGLVREEGLSYEQLKGILELTTSKRQFRPYIKNAWRYMREASE